MSSTQIKKAKSRYQIFKWFLSLFICLIGLGMFLLHKIDYTLVKTWLDTMAVDGSSDLFSVTLFESSTSRLKYFGTIFIVAGIAFNIYSPFFYRIITEYNLSFRKELSKIAGLISQELKSINPIYLYSIFLLIIIGSWIRFRFLGSVIRYDESFTYINYASRHPVVTYALFDIVNNHILHSLLVNLTTSVFGSSEAVIRIPAFAASIMTIPLIFVFCRMIFGKYSSGLIASSLFAFSAYAIEYGINARGYSMIGFFSVSLWIATWMTVRNRESMVGWTLFVLSSFAGMATNPAMFYSIALTSMWYLLSGKFRNLSKIFQHNIPLITSLSISVILTILWYLPGLLFFGLKPFAAIRTGSESISNWLISYSGFAVDLFQKTNAFLPDYATIIIAVAFVIGLVRIPKLGSSLVVIPLLMCFQLITPPTRGLIYVCIMYYIIASGGLALLLEPLGKISERLLRTSAVTVSLIICGILVLPVIRKNSPPDLDNMDLFPEAIEVTDFLKGKISAQTPVLTFVPCDSPLIFYARKFGMPYRYILSSGLIKNKPEAFWLVTNNRWGKTRLRNLITNNHLKDMGFGEPQLRKDFGEVKIYFLR